MMLKKNELYTVLVNTSDGFEDCWEPFFTLFQKYWPECESVVVLNTETKTRSFKNLDIICSTVQKGYSERLTWSECLLRALKNIKTPLVLYLQEDYFIEKKVNHQSINKAVQHMISNPLVKHIALSRHGSLGPYEPYNLGFEKISQKAKYRISTQAGLWRVDALMSHLRHEENGWMFEIYGTWRSAKKEECFLKIKPEEKSGLMPFEYIHTGIIKGKWHPGIVSIFNDNNISVNFLSRGFYKRKNYIQNKFETFRKVAQRPIYFVKQYVKHIINA